MAARKKTTKAPPQAPPSPTSPPFYQQATLNAEEEQFRRFEDLLGNAATRRMDFLQGMMDPRRDIFAECGFPKYVSPQMYQDLVDRNPYAARACEVLPREACQTQLSVFEIDPSEIEEGDDSEDVEEGEDLDGEEDPEEDVEVTNEAPLKFSPKTKKPVGKTIPKKKSKDSAFDKSKKDLIKSLNGVSWYSQDESSLIDTVVEDAAIQAGPGHYSVILIGLNDGLDLSQPVPGVEEAYSMPGRKPADKDVVDETDKNNPKVITDPIANWKDPYKDTIDLSKVSGTPPVKGIYSLNIASEKYDQVLVTNVEGKIEKKSADRKVLYLRVFPETRAMVTRWETNRTSPRYNQPVSYLIALDAGTSFWNGVSGMPTNTVDVHWTRVVHVSGPGKTVNPVASQPLLEPILNPLLNLDKIMGASGEAYWKNCFSILVFETIPQLGPNVKINRADLKDQVENLDNSLQRVLYLLGLQAKTLAPQVIDPTPHIQVNVSAVCVQMSVPVPVFQGYEIGEQASENNDDAWNDRVGKFQRTYLIPKIVVPLYDRLILVGALDEPGEEGYKAKYEPLDRQSAREKAEIAVQLTQAMASYVSSGMAEYITPEDYLIDWLGFDEEMVITWLKKAEKKMMEDEVEYQALAEEQGMVKAPPPGFEWDDPPPEPPAPIKMKPGEKLVQPKANPFAKATANGEGGIR